jgi:hypothetical protein
LFEIFDNHIQPKAIMSKEVDYGHTPHEGLRYADLSRSAVEVRAKLETLLPIISAMVDQSNEQLRMVRKKGLETCFILYLRDPSFFQSTEDTFQLSQKLDDKLIAECEDGSDTKWGSMHHVLYGMIS